MRRSSSSLNLATMALIIATSTAAIAQAGLFDGQVTKVDQSAGKITIKHGAIPKLDMDQGMTMVFAVSEPSLLKAAKAGDKVKFDAERVNGQLTITKLQKAK
jgi:Cu(I)/Ag(I) efflux system periplasmic protein CusF